MERAKPRILLLSFVGFFHFKPDAGLCFIQTAFQCSWRKW